MTQEKPTGMDQTCYSYTQRELAIALGLAPTPFEWVVVEVDSTDPGEAMVDVMIRQHKPPRVIEDNEELSHHIDQGQQTFTLANG